MESDIQKDMQLNEEPAMSPAAASEPQAEGNISAEVVTIKGSASMVTAQTVNVDDGQIKMLRGDTIQMTMKNGGIGVVMSNAADITVENGGIGSVMTREATVKSPAVGFVSAWKVNNQGEIKFLFDLRAGLVAGIAGGLVLAALNLLFGRRTIARASSHSSRKCC